MLIKYKKSSALENYSYSYDKIKPNNKKVYAYLERISKCRIKNAYNLLDKNNETLGIVFCRLINSEKIAGVSVTFLPISSSGYYDDSNSSDIFAATFCYRAALDSEQGFWYFENSSVPSDIQTDLDVHSFTSSDSETYNIIRHIKEADAAPKILTRLSRSIKNFYKNSLKIDRAFNDITFDAL